MLIENGRLYLGKILLEYKFHLQKKVIWIVNLTIVKLISFLGYGALPMYFDVMGTNFIIALRQMMDNEWYEALEFNWLQLFEMLTYAMKFGWNLQRADEQKQAASLGKKRQLGFSKD